MKHIQHIEHAYECRHCKKDTAQKAQMKRVKAPQAAIKRIAGATVLANSYTISLFSTYLITSR